MSDIGGLGFFDYDDLIVKLPVSTSRSEHFKIIPKSLKQSL